VTNPAKTDENQRVIVTVLGADRVGIIAGVSGILAENNINILDISQTTLREFFTMIMVADMKQSKINLNTLKAKLAALGEELGMRIDAMHEDAFRFMHRI
jgi:ACT domain-containing protein